jgi:hypothetical protein
MLLQGLVYSGTSLPSGIRLEEVTHRAYELFSESLTTGMTYAVVMFSLLFFFLIVRSSEIKSKSMVYVLMFALCFFALTLYLGLIHPVVDFATALPLAGLKLFASDGPFGNEIMKFLVMQIIGSVVIVLLFKSRRFSKN